MFDSKLLDNKQEQVVEFTAPDTGDNRYVCTSPGQRPCEGNNESTGMKLEFWFWETALMLAASFMVAGCSKKAWYKETARPHSRHCGHADTSPEGITKWYHDQDTLSLENFNQFIDQDREDAASRREDFILAAKR